MAATLALGAAACGSGDGDDVNTVRVFAAASLTDAFTELADVFEQANPGVEIELNLAGSSSLREQILEGAPADVFASANEEIMAELVAAAAVDGPPQRFAANRLALAVPAGNPASVTGLTDLADPELLVGLCVPQAPCGSLAREALAEAGIEAAVDTEEPDVRALLTKLEAGELDVGLVYRTDLRAADGLVEPVPAPTVERHLTTYPIALLKTAPEPEAAAAFVRFVRSDPGRAILADHGFEP